MEPASLETEIRKMTVQSVTYANKQDWRPTISVQSDPPTGTFLDFVELSAMGLAAIFLSMPNNKVDGVAVEPELALELFSAYFLSSVESGKISGGSNGC